MLPQHSSQMSLYQADAEYLDRVGRESFYGQLSQARSRLFRDDDFAALYCPDNGRPAVPPSLLAVALLLQAHDKVSDQEAIARANYDVRWCVALGIEIATKPFVKSTLQLFRSQLLIHEQAGAIFQASIEEAKRKGFLRGKKRTNHRSSSSQQACACRSCTSLPAPLYEREASRRHWRRNPPLRHRITGNDTNPLLARRATDLRRDGNPDLRTPFARGRHRLTTC